MRIKLDETHFLNSDPFNFWITEEYTNRKGGTSERVISGYHNTFEKACNSFIEKFLKTSNANTLDELKNDVETLKTIVEGWKTNYESNT